MKTFLNTRVSSLVLAGVMLGISSLPSTSAACASGDIALGVQTLRFNIHGARAERALIVDSNCTFIDTKQTEDTNICGSYQDGSTVICNAGSETAVSVQTPEGLDWGSCTPSTDTCTLATTNDVQIEFCCPPAPPGAA